MLLAPVSDPDPDPALCPAPAQAPPETFAITFAPLLGLALGLTLLWLELWLTLQPSPQFRRYLFPNPFRPDPPTWLGLGGRLGAGGGDLPPGGFGRLGGYGAHPPDPELSRRRQGGSLPHLVSKPLPAKVVPLPFFY